jgi:transposase
LGEDHRGPISFQGVETMSRARNGQAISTERASRRELRALRKLQQEAKRDGDLPTWRRATAVLGYLDGVSVIQQAAQLDVTRGSVNRWLQWFEAAGTEGLRPRERLGGEARLSDAQHGQLIALVEAGPLATGYQSGVWTGPMIGELIRRRFGVSYHNHHIPRLLHKLGFSVQRPRKRLAKADAERQALWLKQTFPAIKKKRLPAEAWSCSKTKPASGSTVRCIEPGRA